jgi:hypothetical protein
MENIPIKNQDRGIINITTPPFCIQIVSIGLALLLSRLGLPNEWSSIALPSIIYYFAHTSTGSASKGGHDTTTILCFWDLFYSFFIGFRFAFSAHKTNRDQTITSKHTLELKR